jgi:hypothetical protein
MKRMNFPHRGEKRKLEAQERQSHVKLENTKRFRLKQKVPGFRVDMPGSTKEWHEVK